MGPRDLPTILAGHGYDTGQQRQEPGGGAGGDGGGIPTTSVVLVLVLAAVTVGVLVWLNPGARARARSLAPLALLAGVVITPLIAWTVASSSSEDKAPLLVDRAQGVKGEPELLVSLTDDGLNTLSMTGGRSAVRVICLDRNRQVVLDDRQRWPFIDERGYDYPHVHQPASTEELGRVERCVLHGTRTRLAADVKGALR